MKTSPVGAIVAAVLVAALYEQGGLLRLFALSLLLGVLLYRPGGRPSALEGLLDWLSEVTAGRV